MAGLTQKGSLRGQEEEAEEDWRKIGGVAVKLTGQQVWSLYLRTCSCVSPPLGRIISSQRALPTADFPRRLGQPHVHLTDDKTKV